MKHVTIAGAAAIAVLACGPSSDPLPRGGAGGEGLFDDGDSSGVGGGIGGGPPSCAPADVQAAGDCTAAGVVIDPAFAGAYSCVDLGSLSAIPAPWGGFAMKHGDPSRLLVSGGSRTPGGRLYDVPIGRDSECHVAGFTGASTDVAEAPYNEAGVAYGPNDVLFLAQAIVNRLGQLPPGSGVMAKVVEMTALGVDDSMCGVGFVPSGFGGAGLLKLIDWPVPGYWYSATYADDGAGTFDIVDVVKGPQIEGGAAGFVFIAAGNTAFAEHTVLVSEYDTGSVVAYTLDAGGDPDPATRRPFITGLTGAQGGVVDPLSGDFLFSTFETARIIAIRGFKPPPPIPK